MLKAHWHDGSFDVVAVYLLQKKKIAIIWFFWLTFEFKIADYHLEVDK